MICNVKYIMLLLSLGAMAIAAGQKELPQHESFEGLNPIQKRSIYASTEHQPLHQHNRNKIMKKAPQYENLPQPLTQSVDPLQPIRQNNQSGNKPTSKCLKEIEKLISQIELMERSFMEDAEQEAKEMLLKLQEGYPTLVEEVRDVYDTNMEALAHFMEIYEQARPEPEIEEEDWADHMAEDLIDEIKAWHILLVNDIVNTEHTFENALQELLAYLHEQKNTRRSRFFERKF